MFTPPPLTKSKWVYDDPSGVSEPAPYLRPWPRRAPSRSPRVLLVRRTRFVHREA